MARFKFTLGALLHRREQIEKDRQRELAAAQSVMAALQQELKTLNDSMQTSIGELRGGRLIGRLDLQFLAAHRRYVLSVERRAMTLAQRMAIQQRAVDEARGRLVSAAHDRKMLEKLRDKRKADFLAEQGRKDFAELDDAINRLGASEQAALAADVVSASVAVAEVPEDDGASGADDAEGIATADDPAGAGMKKLINVIALLLAANFLAMAGGVGWLFQSGHLNKQRVTEIKAMLFPPPALAAPTTQPASTDNKPPALFALNQLLDRQMKSATADKQLQAIQSAFDAQMAQLDQRQQQIEDLGRLVDAAQAKNLRDRKALEADRQLLEADKQEAQRLASDQGFQDTLALYNTMSPKQVKSIFMADDDPTIARYLQAMEPRIAAGIIKEFKTPAEMTRIQTVLDRIRAGTAPSSPTTQEAPK